MRCAEHTLYPPTGLARNKPGRRNGVMLPVVYAGDKVTVNIRMEKKLRKLLAFPSENIEHKALCFRANLRIIRPFCKRSC